MDLVASALWYFASHSRLKFCVWSLQRIPDLDLSRGRPGCKGINTMEWCLLRMERCSGLCRPGIRAKLVSSGGRGDGSGRLRKEMELVNFSKVRFSSRISRSFAHLLTCAALNQKGCFEPSFMVLRAGHGSLLHHLRRSQWKPLPHRAFA